MSSPGWFHLHLILDLYSRKIVGWEVHDSDDSAHAAHLVRRTAFAEGIAALATKLVLHGDNGSTLKATTVLAMLNCLGVKPAYSRPRVSDDNVYAESLLRTAKYRPEFQALGFAHLDAARARAAVFVRWYNHDHRYNGIGDASLAQRHDGHDRVTLAARHALYRQPYSAENCVTEVTTTLTRAALQVVREIVRSPGGSELNRRRKPCSTRRSRSVCALTVGRMNPPF